MVPDSTDLDRLIQRADPAAGQSPASPEALTVTQRAPATGRRGGGFAVAASAIAVVAVGAIVVLIAQLTAPSGQITPGGNGARPALTGPPGSGPATPPSGGQTKTGPTESHTPYSGPEFQRAQRLLATLRSLVPARYTLPPMPTGTLSDYPTPTGGPHGDDLPPASFQAVQDEGPFQGWTGWEYDGDTNVTRNGRTGSVGLKVWTQIPAWSDNPCTLVNRLYWVHGPCTVATANGKQVAVSRPGPGTPAGGFDSRANQWATYRYPDGTVVMILQSLSDYPSRTPSLTAPVFTTDQLAALAVDPRFSS